MVSDFSVHRFTMIVVVGERVVNRCKGEMGVVLEQLFGSLSMPQSGDSNRPNRYSGAFNSRTPSADARIAHDMGVSYCCHA